MSGSLCSYEQTRLHREEFQVFHFFGERGSSVRPRLAERSLLKKLDGFLI